MGDPRHLRPDEVEIVIARELRKAGVPLSTLRAVARRALGADGADGYAMELAGLVSADGVNEGAIHPPRRVLVEVRNEGRLADVADVQTMAQRTPPEPEADAPKRLQPVRTTPAAEAAADRPLRVLVSTTGFERAAVVEAHTLGVALLRIADGRAAFRRSQWAMGEQPPAWIPEYMTELAELGPAGDDVRYQLITGRVAALASR